MDPTTTKEKSEFHRHESRQYYKYPWVFALLFRSTNDLDPLQNRLCDLGRRGFATKVRGQHRPLAQHGIHSVLNSSRGLAVAQMAEHHRSGADGSHRVGLVLACYIRCGAVYAVAMGKQELVGRGVATYGSPITNLSPAFTEGTTPREPTRAAAASLACVRSG